MGKPRREIVHPAQPTEPPQGPPPPPPPSNKPAVCPVDGAEPCHVVKTKDILLADILESIVDMLYTGVDVTRCNAALAMIRELRE